MNRLLFVCLLLAGACQPVPGRSPVRGRDGASAGVGFIADKLPNVYAFAGDDKDLYLAVEGRSSDAIWRLAPSGGATTTFAPSVGIAVGMAVDASHVYFAQYDRLLAFPRAGGAPVTLAQVQGDLSAFSLAGKSIYYAVWQNNATQIFVVDRAGGKAPSLVGTVSAQLDQIAVDADSVWGVSNAAGKVALVQLPRAGGSAVSIAPVTRYPYWASDGSVVVDSGSVYFFGQDVARGFPAPVAAVLAFDKKTQKVRVVARLAENVTPFALVADDANLYWSCYDNVYQASKRGSAVATIGWPWLGDKLVLAGGAVYDVGGPDTGESLIRCSVAPCQPTTCDTAWASCGSIDDGCGGTLDCGGCATGLTCGGGGVDNACGKACQPSGGACSDGADCCGGLYCTDGVCSANACNPIGGRCKMGNDCCGDAYCVSGACTLECSRAGQPCQTGRVDEGGCCSGLLCGSDGTCGSESGGGGGGGGFGCSSDADCPGGYCAWSPTYQTYICA